MWSQRRKGRQLKFSPQFGLTVGGGGNRLSKMTANFECSIQKETRVHLQGEMHLPCNRCSSWIQSSSIEITHISTNRQRVKSWKQKMAIMLESIITSIKVALLPLKPVAINNLPVLHAGAAEKPELRVPSMCRLVLPREKPSRIPTFGHISRMLSSSFCRIQRNDQLPLSNLSRSHFLLFHIQSGRHKSQRLPLAAATS